MKKVTVSLPDDVVDAVAAVVEAGASPSFSSYVAAATTARLNRDGALARLRAHTGGPHGGELRSRAQRALGIEPGATDDR